MIGSSADIPRLLSWFNVSQLRSVTDKPIMLFFPPSTLVGPMYGGAGYCGLGVARCVHTPAFTFIMLDFRASVAMRISQTYNGSQQLVLDVSQPVEFVWV